MVFRTHDAYMDVFAVRVLKVDLLRVRMLLFFVFVALPVAQGLYFHIAETERKCFIEEIPDETMVIGN